VVNKERFPLYGYICNAVAILFFLAHFLYIIDRCPYGISTVIRISFIQVILAILAIYFGCCSKTKEAKLSIILGIVVIVILIFYSIIVIYPCISY